MQEMCQLSQKELQQLAEKYQEQLQEVRDLHEKIQVAITTFKLNFFLILGILFCIGYCDKGRGKESSRGAVTVFQLSVTFLKI